MRRAFFDFKEPHFHNFNPRTREGCDDGNYKTIAELANISIHAPVKGATTTGIPGHAQRRHFNPRTREGCDLLDYCITDLRSNISIHAPVKGATIVSTGYNGAPRGISIHAPVKGATGLTNALAI